MHTTAGLPFPAFLRRIYSYLSAQDMSRPRTVAAFGVVTFFLIFILLSGVDQSLSSMLAFLFTLPDFSKYNNLRTLDRHDFPIG